MTEFRRLLDTSDDPLAVELLHSGAEEVPSIGSVSHAAAALGVGAALLSGSMAGAKSSGVVGSIGAAAAKAGGAALPFAPKAGVLTATAAAPGIQLGLVALAKPLVIGLMSGALVVVGAGYASAPRESELPRDARSVPAERALARDREPTRRAFGTITTEPSAPKVGSTPDSLAEPPVLIEQQPMRAEGRAVGTGPAVTSDVSKPARSALMPENEASGGSRAAFAVEESAETAAAPATDVQSDPSLKAEIERLDKARQALLFNDPESALRELAKYRAARPSGVLAPEALVIRIQSLEKLGQHAQAESLARDFIRHYPKHRHAQALSNQFRLSSSP